MLQWSGIYCYLCIQNLGLYSRFWDLFTTLLRRSIPWGSLSFVEVYLFEMCDLTPKNSWGESFVEVYQSTKLRRSVPGG